MTENKLRLLEDIFLSKRNFCKNEFFSFISSCLGYVATNNQIQLLIAFPIFVLSV